MSILSRGGAIKPVNNTKNTNSELKKAGIKTRYGLNVDAVKYAKVEAELKGISLHQEVKDMSNK